MSESYQEKLRRHSSESRVDPLRDAVRRAVALWHQEDELEKNDLSENFWRAMGELEATLKSAKRGGEEDVPEVEVTESAFRAAHEDAGERSPLPVESPQTPVAARRSGAKNVSAPEYQNAFISEARHSMGQPDVQDAEALLGYVVVLIFNAETPRQGSTGPLTQARGVLTRVMDHPSGGPTNSVYLMLDDDKDAVYPLNSVQEIRRVR
jgi:hypothetical protein